MANSETKHQRKTPYISFLNYSSKPVSDSILNIPGSYDAHIFGIIAGFETAYEGKTCTGMAEDNGIGKCQGRIWNQK